MIFDVPYVGLTGVDETLSVGWDVDCDRSEYLHLASATSEQIDTLAGELQDLIADAKAALNALFERGAVGNIKCDGVILMVVGALMQLTKPHVVHAPAKMQTVKVTRDRFGEDEEGNDYVMQFYVCADCAAKIAEAFQMRTTIDNEPIGWKGGGQ